MGRGVGEHIIEIMSAFHVFAWPGTYVSCVLCVCSSSRRTRPTSPTYVCVLQRRSGATRGPSRHIWCPSGVRSHMGGIIREPRRRWGLFCAMGAERVRRKPLLRTLLHPSASEPRPQALISVTGSRFLAWSANE